MTDTKFLLFLSNYLAEKHYTAKARQLRAIARRLADAYTADELITAALAAERKRDSQEFGQARIEYIREVCHEAAQLRHNGKDGGR
jgi:hypothetical protein